MQPGPHLHGQQSYLVLHPLLMKSQRLLMAVIILPASTDPRRATAAASAASPGRLCFCIQRQQVLVLVVHLARRFMR